MNVFLRVLAVGLSVLIVWSAAASRVADHARLPLDAVVKGAAVTQRFGCTTVELEPFDPFCPSRHVHTGIDLAAPAGSLIYAATAGRVRVAYDAHGAGLFVSVAFDDHVRILYCHLRMARVVTGNMVESGAPIGEVGSSGLSTGPHLHFEIQVDGRSVDPAQWLASAGP
jgi:murein DD-endopeptidase MepM/ murein hydrolase activator NlpD